MTTITITGYEEDCNCQHCGRKLRHGIRLDDGRVVGATCLDKKMTKPKQYQGKTYRLGSEIIIRAARCAQYVDPRNWSRYGVNHNTMTFEDAAA